MKNFVLTITILLSSIALNAQESKIKKENFFVDGVCKMCEDRIENAALRTKGVKTAEWDKVSKQLTVLYNSEKTDIESIKEAVAAKGHDSDTQKSDSTSYSQLPKCCRYKHGAKCND